MRNVMSELRDRLLIPGEFYNWREMEEHIDWHHLKFVFGHLTLSQRILTKPKGDFTLISEWFDRLTYDPDTMSTRWQLSHCDDYWIHKVYGFGQKTGSRVKEISPWCITRPH